MPSSKTFPDLLENQASVDALRHLLSLMYPSKCVACTAFVTNNKNDDREAEKESFFLFFFFGSRTFGSLDEKSMESWKKKSLVHSPLVRVH